MLMPSELIDTLPVLTAVKVGVGLTLTVNLLESAASRVIWMLPPLAMVTASSLGSMTISSPPTAPPVLPAVPL